MGTIVTFELAYGESVKVVFQLFSKDLFSQSSAAYGWQAFCFCEEITFAFQRQLKTRSLLFTPSDRAKVKPPQSMSFSLGKMEGRITPLGR